MNLTKTILEELISPLIYIQAKEVVLLKDLKNALYPIYKTTDVERKQLMHQLGFIFKVSNVTFVDENNNFVRKSTSAFFRPINDRPAKLTYPLLPHSRKLILDTSSFITFDHLLANHYDLVNDQTHIITSGNSRQVLFMKKTLFKILKEIYPGKTRHDLNPMLQQLFEDPRLEKCYGVVYALTDGFYRNINYCVLTIEN